MVGGVTGVGASMRVRSVATWMSPGTERSAGEATTETSGSMIDTAPTIHRSRAD
ncbi:MAG: hypothetical protein ACJAR2_004045 [Ilumatobacter sp.]|jgi:hypothetical protein